MTKQVIVMRNDLNMRKGKMCAQSGHASMAFLTREGFLEDEQGAFVTALQNPLEVDEWMKNSFTKICLKCNSEEELDEIYQKAKDAGLVVHMVIDNGLTEFNGVKTKTCLCIGPHDSYKIDPITSHLSLL